MIWIIIIYLQKQWFRLIKKGSHTEVCKTNEKNYREIVLKNIEEVKMRKILKEDTDINQLRFINLCLERGVKLSTYKMEKFLNKYRKKNKYIPFEKMIQCEKFLLCKRDDDELKEKFIQERIYFWDDFNNFQEIIILGSNIMMNLLNGCREIFFDGSFYS